MNNNNDLYYRSLRTRLPGLLRRAEYQLINCCWAIAHVREFEAILKLEGELEFDETLSIQELLDMIPRDWISADGALRFPYYGSRDTLIFPGIVKEELNPLTYSLDQYPWYSYYANYEDIVRYCIRDMEFYYVDDFWGSEEFFEMYMEDFVDRSIPISITVVAYESIRFLRGNDVYCPSPAEVANLPFFLHAMLLTGHGTNAYGEDFWEAQDSYGEGRGVNGFIRLAKHVGIVVMCSSIKI